jgi:hypothetical protein
MIELTAPNFDNDPSYIEANEFAKSIEPEEGVDYEWVADYATDLFDRLTRSNKELDEKANDIVKYLGGGSGLFALLAITKVDPANSVVLWSVLPAFIVALVAIYRAASVRRPMDLDLPPSVKAAFDYAVTYNTTARAAFVGKWHVACQHAVLVNGYKTKLVEQATRWFVLAIASLTLPIVASLIRAIT